MLTKILSLVFLTGLAQAADPVTTVNSVDLDRYQGRWFEIAAIPQSFQKQCVGQTTAEYKRLPDGFVSVVNSCAKADGSFSVSEGRARVVDAKTNAKLRVTFVKLFDWIFLFGGDYWIIDLGENYEYAVVGHPTRDYGWILSRTPALSPETLQGLASRLEAQGYDTCTLITTPQAGGLTEKRALCEVVQTRP